ncbi:MAG TPA: DUF177 domain-containing protein [Acidimicrobiales bacterium]|nr:DUF177 domain-containing protein [Acidimicrobiales bacterium]
MRTESGPQGVTAPTDSSAGGPRRPARPFVVQVAGLRKVAGTTRHEARRGVIDGLGVVGVVVPEGSPVVADVELSSYPGGISAVGTFSAPWVGECRRCGGPVSGTVTAAVRDRYAPDGSGDEDAYPLNGGELDLEPLARDAVLLELPLAPLCSEDCLGLCPRCGTNWNESTCGCDPHSDPRWSVLDSLRDP